MVAVVYDLVVLVLRPNGFSENHSLSLFTVQNGIGVLAIAPLIAAIGAKAVAAAQDGRKLKFSHVVRHGLVSMPLVIAVQAVSYLGVAVATIAFVLPGVILGLRWSVISLVVAVESKEPWRAFKRSSEITEGHYWHIFIVTIIFEALIIAGAFGVHLVTNNSGLGAMNTSLEVIVQVIIAAYGALILTALYLDLRLCIACPAMSG